MPSRNVLKEDIPQSYYHVYARGAGKQTIFCDSHDFNFFLALFKRYLMRNEMVNTSGAPYPYHGDKLKLLAYCLMGNHFHLFIYQEDEGTMCEFMRSVMTSYSRHFNKKYKRSGPLFESRYKASRISQQPYLEHVSRYIHLNPRYWQRYQYSSFVYYDKLKPPEWLKPDMILEMFESSEDYKKFVADYEDYKKMLDEIKHELADK